MDLPPSPSHFPPRPQDDAEAGAAGDVAKVEIGKEEGEMEEEEKEEKVGGEVAAVVEGDDW